MRQRHLRLVLLAAASLGFVAATPAAQAAAADWPTYHADNFRGGYDASASPLSGINTLWTSAALGGTVYAEPLVVGNLVIVADEGDDITALDGTTGAIVWQRNVGTPVTLTNPPFGCWNISPLGITGTPVVDPVAKVVYALAFQQSANYYLVGLNLVDGTDHFAKVAIAPAGFDVYHQQQRPALTLANGYVYAAFGGYAGDCGTYHGWLVGVPASGSGTQVVFQDQASLPPAQGANENAFWATAGPSVDNSGNLYMASGNGSSTTTYDFGNTIFKLSPTLSLLDYWAPSVWATLNNNDADLGSAGTALVGASHNIVFQVGKPGWGYLLNAGSLSAGGHLGSAPFEGQVCNAATTDIVANDQVFGGVAYADPYIYVPCPEGIKALQLGAGPSFSVAWSSAALHPGPPIVAGGVVWAIDVSAGRLYGLNPLTGATRFNLSVGSMTHFATPAAGLGRIYVPTANKVVAFGQGPGQYHTLAPARILDTRTAGGTLGQGSTRNIQVTGRGGIPSTGVAAVVANVTAANTTAPSFLTLYPTGYTRPATSNLNWVAGQLVPNLVEVAVGDAGQITAYNLAGRVDLIVDVEGWVSTPSSTPGPDGLYHPLTPQRILDTRVTPPGITSGGTYTLQLTGKGTVPSSGVEAVVLNLTVANPSGASFLEVYPTGTARPSASNLNFLPGQTVANRVIAMLGTNGSVTIFNLYGTADLIVDVAGWFTDSTNPAATGSQFVGTAPSRIVDTRNGTGGFNSPIGQQQSIAVQVAGAGAVPSMASATPPKAVVLNVTAIGPTAASYLTVWADGLAQPGTSDVNFAAGRITPNLVVAQVGANGKVRIFNWLGATHVVVDVLGWYQ